MRAVIAAVQVNIVGIAKRKKLRILTVCPTKGRPDDFKRMAESFYDTSATPNTLLAIFPENEPFDFVEFPKTKTLVCNGTVTECINAAFNKYPDYDYYALANDDIVYRTQDWDLKLINALGGQLGISYGNDLLQGENLCTFPFISGGIVRAVGYLQMPKLNRYSGDVVWRFLGRNTGCLKYVPEVIISHFWHGNPDISVNHADMVIFAVWVGNQAQSDVKKIQEVLCQK